MTTPSYILDIKNLLEGSVDGSGGSIGIKLNELSKRGFNLYLCKNLATTTLSATPTVGSVSVTVASANGAVVGDCINIKEGCMVFQSIIKSINGLIITMSSPIDSVYTNSAQVCFGEWNFATANGSVTPVIFQICPPSGCRFIICSITFTISDGTAGDISKFGGGNALSNGIVARRIDGDIATFFLISNNGGFKQYGYSVDYNDRAGGAGLYSVEAFKDLRMTNGAPIFLEGITQDEFQVYVPDNLTGLTEMTCVAHGYIEEY